MYREGEKRDRGAAKKAGMTMKQWENSPQDRKIDAAGQRKMDMKAKAKAKGRKKRKKA